MAQTVTDLNAKIAAVDAKIDGVSTQLTDLAGDFDAAVKKLQDDIANGQDLTPSVTALSALSDKLDAASGALAAIDVKAETISGVPTPPPPPPPPPVV